MRKHPQQGRSRRAQSARPVPVRPSRRVVHRFLDHVLCHDRQRGGCSQHLGEMRFAGAGRPIDQYQHGQPTCCCCRTESGHGQISTGTGPRTLNHACAAGGARLEGFEPPTPGSEDQCSNPLSYRRMRARVTQALGAARRRHCFNLVDTGSRTSLASSVQAGSMRWFRLCRGPSGLCRYRHRPQSSPPR